MNQQQRKHARLTSFLRKALKPLYAICALAPVFAVHTASAQLYWDANAGTGGTGTWDTTTMNWGTAANTAPTTAWVNGANTAIFSSATAGTVTVGTTGAAVNVIANGLTFTVTGYTVTDNAAGGGTGTLTLIGPSTISVSPSVTATVAAVLNDTTTTDTLTISGGGTVILSGANAGAYLGSSVTIAASTTVQAASTGNPFAPALPQNAAFVVNGALDLNGTSQQIASLAGTTAAAQITNTNTGAYASLTVGVNSYTGEPSFTTFAGQITDSNAGAVSAATIEIPTAASPNGTMPNGDLGLTINPPAGAGYTLVLTNTTNNYSGLTVVSNGGTTNVATLQAGALNTFSPNSVMDIGAGGTVDLNGFSQTIAGLSSTAATPDVGTITNTAANTTAMLTVGNANLAAGVPNALFSSVNIQNGAAGTGVIGLTKIGAYTQVLAGINTYSGGTIVSAGVLTAGSATGFSPNSAYAVNGTLDLNGYNATAGSLSGSGSVTNGIAGDPTPGPGPATLTTGSNNSSTMFSGVISDGVSGALSLTKTGSGVFTLTNTDTYSGATNVNAGTLQIGDGVTGGNLSNTTGVTVANNAILATNLVTGATFTPGIFLNGTNAALNAVQSGTNTITGAIVGTGVLNQLGAGTTILTKDETYTGATTITAGTLSLAATGSIAAGSTVGVGTAGTLNFAPGGIVFGNATLTGNATVTGSGGLIGGTLGVTGGNWNATSGTVTGLVTASGAANTFTIGAGANLTATAGVNLTGGQIAGTGTLTGSLNDTSAQSSTFGGVIAGAGNTLTVNNAATTLTLTADNTYTGATTVTAGTLSLTSTGSIAAGSTVNVGTAGTLNFSAGGIVFGNATLTGGATVTGSGGLIGGTLGVTGGNWNATSGTVTGLVTASGAANTFTIGAGANLTATAGVNLTGGQIAGTGTLTGSLNDTSAQSSTFGGVIAGAGSTLTVNNAATTLTLTGTSTYTGATTVTAGTLQVGNGTSGNLTGTSGVAVANNANLVTNLATGATFAPAVALNGLNAALNAIQSGTNTLSGVISGAGIFNQNGTGTTILTNTETYTGATTVTAGTLSLSSTGSIAAGSTVNVGTAGTLNFSAGGIVFGNATLTGGATVTGSGGLIGGTLGVTGGNWNATGGGVVGLVTASGAANTFTIGSGASLIALSGVNLTGGQIAGAGTLIGSLNDTSAQSSTFGGVIAGAGNTLTVNNAATTLTLTGANTYTGATTVTAGTLSLGNTGSIAAGSTVNVGTAGTLNFALGGTVFGNATLTGGATVTGIATIAGTLGVTGGNWNATGGGVIGLVTASGAANTFTIGSGASLTALSGVNLTGGQIAGAGSLLGSLNDTSAQSSTFGGVIADFGATPSTVTVNNAATTLTLTGTNTYTGATTVTAGTLSLGTTGSIAAGSTVNVGTAGTLNFAPGGVVNGNATLTGGATVTGSAIIFGTLGVTGGNWNAVGSVIGLVTASGAANTFTIGSGAGLNALSGVSLTGGQIAGAGTGTLTGSLNDTSAQSSTFGGVIAGAGNTLTVNNAATTLTLTGANTYTGATTITAGTLSLGPTGSIAAGSTVGVGTAGALNFAGGGTVNGNATLTGGATVTGSGGTIGGTLGVTGGNWNATSGTVKGLITASGAANTFTIGAGANLTAAAGVNLTGGFIGGTGTLSGSLNDTSAQANTFGGVIANGASPSILTVNNAATTLTLTSANTYSGGTTLQAGTLVVSNSGALGKGNVTVNGGALQAGGSNMLINVGGTYTQGSGGELDLRIGGTAAGTFDRLSVTGAASLSGRLSVSAINGFVPVNGQSLAVITAASVTGQFQQVPASLANFPLVKLTLAYLPNEVLLDFSQGTFTPPQLILTPNQEAVAIALNHLASNAESTKLKNFLDSLPMRSIPGAYDRIAAVEYGAIFEISRAAAKIEAVTIENRLDEIHAESVATLAAGPAGPSDDKGSKEVMPPPEKRLGVFSNGSGQFVSVGDTPNAAGYNFGSGAATVGVDYRFTEHFVAGVLLNYTGTSGDLVNGGRINANAFRGGAYASLFGGGAYVNGFVGGAYNDYDVTRQGLASSVRGSTSGGDFNALIATGYDVHAGNFTYGPVASFQYTYTGLDSFDERGSLVPLHINSTSGDSFLTNVGVRATYDWHIGTMVLVPEIRATWQHEYGNTNDEISAVMLLGSPAFSVTSSPIGRDTFVLNAGFTLRITPDLAAYAFYDGELACTNYQANNFLIGFKASF